MNKGFTLVELIAVVVILGLLTIITTPAYDTISKNIKTQNFNSKKNTIKKQTLAYVERYFKDKIYPKLDASGNIPTDDASGEKIYETNYYCFTVEYLIQNGIISSDNEKEEYIENNITGEKLKDIYFIQVAYDTNNFKLVAETFDEISSSLATYVIMEGAHHEKNDNANYGWLWI